MSKRAIRRAHYIRLKKNKIKHLKEEWWFSNKMSDDEIKNHSVILINTPKLCSCWMCCNPRHNGWLKKHETKTRQEKRSYIDEMEQINEWGADLC